MGSCSFSASQEVLPYCYNGTSTVLLEDQLYHRKTNCCIGRSTVLLEIDCIIGRSIAMLEDEWKIKGIIRNQLYWRQATGLDGNYRSRKITARRWLHKYVGVECGASSFTWYSCLPQRNKTVVLSVYWNNKHTSTKMAKHLARLGRSCAAAPGVPSAGPHDTATQGVPIKIRPRPALLKSTYSKWNTLL